MPMEVFLGRLDLVDKSKQARLLEIGKVLSWTSFWDDRSDRLCTLFHKPAA